MLLITKTLKDYDHYDMLLLQNLLSVYQQEKSIHQIVLHAFAHHCSYTAKILRGTFVAESSLFSLIVIEISRRFVLAIC